MPQMPRGSVRRLEVLFNVQSSFQEHDMLPPSCSSIVPRKCNLPDVLSLSSVNRNKSRQLHVCGHKYCETCKMFMSKDHVCYMKTTAEEETMLLKRKQENRAKEDDDVKKIVFFLLWMHARRDDSMQRGLSTSAADRMWKLQPIWLPYKSVPTRIHFKEDDSLQKLS